MLNQVIVPIGPRKKNYNGKPAVLSYLNLESTAYIIAGIHQSWVGERKFNEVHTCMSVYVATCIK